MQYDWDDGEITDLLQAVQQDQPGAADRLMSEVYGRLKQLAQNRVYSGPNQLQSTTLVHETYLRLFSKDSPSWENRNHFFWAAARAMRDILIEEYRHQNAKKRGGGVIHLSINGDIPGISQQVELIEIDESIQRLQASYPTAARIVMLRFYGGLTREQIAELMDVSVSSVWREWTFAKAWLLKDLASDPH